MLIVKCKSFRTKKELAGFEAEWNRKVRQGDAVFLPADFDVVFHGPAMERIIVWDHENHVPGDPNQEAEDVSADCES